MPSNSQWAMFLCIAGPVYLGIAIILLGRARPMYSQIRDTISELGEIGSPRQRFVALDVFLPIGCAMAIVGLLAQTHDSATAMLAGSIAIGYLVAAAFPCDRGSPLSGSTRQAIHNLGGGVEYVGGAFAFFRMAEHAGNYFRVLGFFVLATAVALSVTPLAPVRGLIQRVAEICLFGGLALSLTSAVW